MTYVLIPGSDGSAWYWHRVEAELRRRGQDTVAVELPTGDDAAGLAEYADAVIEAIGGRGDLVLVAQSMGAYTAPLVCARVPVSLLILVNGMIPAPGETAGDWWANTGQAPAKRDNDVRAGRPADAEWDLRELFFHDVPADITEVAFANPRPQSDTPFGQPWPLAAWPDVPTRALSGRDDRLFPVGFQRRVAEERLGITPDELPGGHLVAFSHPVEVAERLESYRVAALAATR